jgi:DNA primase
MGTALTERQLRELGRLARRLYLCFDADAAGEEATLRGMELAAAQGFDVRVVALPPGLDPADAAADFEERLRSAESYVVYRIRVELDRAADRQVAYLRVQEVLDRFRDSPERQEAWRLANDRLGMTVQLRAAATGTGAAGAPLTPKLLEAAERLERGALAGVVAHRELGEILAELGPEHFDVELHRRLRAHLVENAPPDAELLALKAELDARAAADGIDEGTAEQLLLRLRERRLRRDLAAADPDRARELQTALTRIRETFDELAARQPAH